MVLILLLLAGNMEGGEGLVVDLEDEEVEDGGGSLAFPPLDLEALLLLVEDDLDSPPSLLLLLLLPLEEPGLLPTGLPG
jgi:hypothetical protein